MTSGSGERPLEGFRLMAVHAHPDDESSKGAATMARYAAEGARVLVVSCTGGERGDVLNPRLKDDPEVARDLVGFRRREMAAAQDALGVEHEWLGFTDSGLPEGDPLPPLPEGCFALEPVEVPAEALVRLMRSFRPHVVTTYDEQGGYPHPDHVKCHDVSVAAFRSAGDPLQFSEAGDPWQPLKLYYNQSLNADRMTRLHEVMTERGLESPFGEWLERRAARPARTEAGSLTRVDAADYFDARDRALLAHATQIDPDGWWFGIPRDVEREVWPWEDFEVAMSYVAVPESEDSLFAGLSGAAAADAKAAQPGMRIGGPIVDHVKER